MSRGQALAEYKRLGQEIEDTYRLYHKTLRPAEARRLREILADLNLKYEQARQYLEEKM